jgi:S-formylglutathione hydrolase
MNKVSAAKCFGGTQAVFDHDSEACGCTMRFGVFTPPGDGPFPVLYFLSGLTCTHENFVVKAGAQRMAAELGLVLVAPDTSPRGDDVPDAPDDYDFGKGAGFYVNATQEPWSRHYQMASYVQEELPSLIADHFPVMAERQGIFGHSMGGHGALVAHFSHPQRFRSVSAFAPIVAPTQVPWGQKAFPRYLGDDEAMWQAYDACALVRRQPTPASILVDQGDADTFLSEQLRPELFERACSEAGQALTLRRQPGYDHSYFFIATFIDDHLRWHAQALA